MSISIRHRLAALIGWRAGLACFLAGALMVLGFAPTHAWPVIFIALPVFYVLLAACTTRRAAILRAFMFGYGYFMAGTWWIAKALLVDAAQFGWLIPFSILGLSAVMALWFAVFGWLKFTLPRSSAMHDVFLFAILWVAVEYLRTLGMLGFPWNLAGYISLASLSVAQLGATLGIYGLSFLVILTGLLPLLWQSRFRQAAWLLPLAIVGGAYGYGAQRIPAEIAYTDTRIRLVQPSIPQGLKWTPQGKAESLRAHADLTRAPGAAADVIIWPETALPFTLRENSPWPQQLAQLLAPGQTLITGALMAEGEGRETKLWNSIVAINSAGEIAARYAKHQLVPFGEFVPLRNVLPIEKITPGGIDFSRGSGPKTVKISGIPAFSPLVCYEVIFPAMAVQRGQQPAWMLNVTNDGWYGDTAGPYQHFDMARMRAIEQGLPLVRAANNGISAIIDPYGRLAGSLPLNAVGVLDGRLPAPLPQ